MQRCVAPPSIVRWAPVATVYRQSPPEGRATDCGSGYRLSLGERLADLEDVPVENRRLERAGVAQARQTTIKRAPGPGPIKITSGPPASYSPPGELNDATIEAKVVAGSQGDREPATCPQRRAGGGGMPRAFAGAGGAAEGCSGPAQRVAHRYRRRTRDFQAPGAATIDWDRGRALIARARRNHSFDRASHGLSVRSVSCAA